MEDGESLVEFEVSSRTIKSRKRFVDQSSFRRCNRRECAPSSPWHRYQRCFTKDVRDKRQRHRPLVAHSKLFLACDFHNNFSVQPNRYPIFNTIQVLPLKRHEDNDQSFVCSPVPGTYQRRKPPRWRRRRNWNVSRRTRRFKATWSITPNSRRQKASSPRWRMIRRLWESSRTAKLSPTWPTTANFKRRPSWSRKGRWLVKMANRSVSRVACPFLYPRPLSSSITHRLKCLHSLFRTRWMEALKLFLTST